MTDGSVQDPATTPRSRGEVAGLAVLVVVASVLAGLVLGWALFGRGGFPLDGSAEAGFARDMQTHHGQAVEMSLLVDDRSNDPAIRILAKDIATSQQHQAGQMFGWLQVWGLSPTGSQPPMAWMGSEHHDATSATSAGGDTVAMPGMASPADLARLKAATGVEAEKIFLTLMIAHHKGGVEMADAVLARSDVDVVVTLARSMKMAQTAEITAMQQLLAARS